MAHGMTAVRQDPFARLDAWVLEEVEALGKPRVRPPEPVKRRADSPAAFGEGADADTVSLDQGPLPMDEGQFVQRATEWLQGRPNADLILEEIWRNVVTPEALEDLDGLGGGSDAAAQDDAQALAEAEPPEGPAGAADGTPPAPAA